jgi:hypothetical protein
MILRLVMCLTVLKYLASCHGGIKSTSLECDAIHFDIRYRRFGGLCCCHRQTMLKMEEVGPSETSIRLTKQHDVTPQEIKLFYMIILIVLAQLPTFIVLNPSRELNSRSATQIFLNMLWKPIVAFPRARQCSVF